MEEKSKAVKIKSLRLTPDVYAEFEEFQQSIGAPTATEFVETILEQQHRPVKNNQDYAKKLKENADLIEKLNQKIVENELKTADLVDKLTALEGKTESDTGEIMRLQDENTRLKAENSQLIEKGKLPENCKVIQFDPLNLLLLQYVADREGRKREQEWSIHDVINYFIHNRFEMGSVNGNMDAVPDSAVREFKSIIQC